MKSLKSIFVRQLNRLLRPVGLGLVRLKQSPVLTLDEAILRITKRGLEVRTVIDVGASDGRWSKQVQGYWPEASYVLIEANDFHREKLQRLKAKDGRIDYVMAAASDAVGQVYFDASDPLGGLASRSPEGRGQVAVPATTIDAVVAEKRFEGPFLIKLDTHGFEVPILRGAQGTLKRTNLIVVETYNFKLTGQSLRFHEMCGFLESEGFRPVDMCDPLYRPKDGVLWQFDLFFVRQDRAEFQSNTYG